MTRSGLFIVAAALSMSCGTALAEVTANAAVANNYLWRGLTQTENEAAVSGGIDYASDNGFYVGTWVSNVQYGPADTFSYEHDVYFGYSGESDNLSYDVGFLYYNYDDVNNIDFHEIYGSIGIGDFSVTAFLLSGTEADEPTPAMDFGFGEAYYVSLDYEIETEKGFGIGLHAGRHDGDFNEFFNGVPGSYTDYSVSFSVDNFTLTISDTDLDDSGPSDIYDNDEMKFVVSYGVDFEL